MLSLLWDLRQNVTKLNSSNMHIIPTVANNSRVNCYLVRRAVNCSHLHSQCWVTHMSEAVMCMDLFALPCLSTSLPSCWDMHILGLELGIFGGLITPVCSYITDWEYSLRFALCCVVLYIRTSTSWVALVAKLVERLPRQESVVGSNPTQGSSSSSLLLFWMKEPSWV